MDRSARIVVLGGLLGAWSPSATGTAAPAKETAAPEGGAAADSSPSQVPNLVVWVEPGVSDRERVTGWVEERGAEVLREHQPPLEPEDLIRVAVKGEPYDYRIHTALLRRRRLLEDQLDVIVCECSSDEMLERVGEAIDAGARRLTDAAVRERADAPASGPDEGPGEGSEVEPVVTTKEARERLGPLGYVGIGLGVLGAGMVASGIPLALRREELRGEPGALSSYSTRPPGVGLAVGGGVALAAGVALIVVDVVRHRTSRMAFAPAVGRGQVGLSIVGRF